MPLVFILKISFLQMIVSLMYKDAIWFRVQINETPLTPFFLVFYPNSTLVLSSPITASYKDIVLEVKTDSYWPTLHNE